MFPVFFCLSLEKVDSQNQKLCGDTIVLYDLGYRTIRFGISYYTISGIVLYDFENRYRGFPNPVMGWGEAYFRPETTPTLPPAVQADVFGGNKCHTCGWGDAMSVM